jgi:hypothetical protein
MPKETQKLKQAIHSLNTKLIPEALKKLRAFFIGFSGKALKEFL